MLNQSNYYVWLDSVSSKNNDCFEALYSICAKGRINLQKIAW